MEYNYYSAKFMYAFYMHQFFRIHVSSLSSREGASEEQRGDAAKIPSQEGVEHRTRPDLHVLQLSKMDNPEVLGL